jgi:hypothetical protein
VEEWWIVGVGDDNRLSEVCHDGLPVLPIFHPSAPPFFPGCHLSYGSFRRTVSLPELQATAGRIDFEIEALTVTSGTLTT